MMVVANRNLLREARRLAIRDERFAMRLRGVLLVVPKAVEKPAARPGRRG